MSIKLKIIMIIVSDSIETTRRDSLTLSQPLDIEDRILQDVTDKSIAAQCTDSGEVPDTEVVRRVHFCLGTIATALNFSSSNLLLVKLRKKVNFSSFKLSLVNLMKERKNKSPYFIEMLLLKSYTVLYVALD